MSCFCSILLFVRAKAVLLALLDFLFKVTDVIYTLYFLDGGKRDFDQPLKRLLPGSAYKCIPYCLLLG